MRPKVLAYYFPDWHVDQRNSGWFGSGWTEWDLLRQARPRFEGHRQPLVPLHGEFDESAPAQFDEQLNLARQYGVDGLLFDFYWYDDGPYLNGALDRGFLGATRRGATEFGLMWANHDLRRIFPADSPSIPPAILKRGAVDRDAFRRMTTKIISSYFSQPDYLRIDGKPWFSIYELGTFIAGMGGVKAAREAIDEFRASAIEAGFPGVHLNAVVWGFAVLPDAQVVDSPATVLSALGFDSATSYVWIHHVDVRTTSFPQASWHELADAAFDAFDEYAATLPVPFHPNVTVGWDASPRTNQSEPFVQAGYPWMSVWKSSPGDFRAGLRRAMEFAHLHNPQAPIITVNAWNEWTEGSVLLPSTLHQYEFLEAIRDELGMAHNSHHSDTSPTLEGKP